MTKSPRREEDREECVSPWELPIASVRQGDEEKKMSQVKFMVEGERGGKIKGKRKREVHTRNQPSSFMITDNHILGSKSGVYLI